MSKVLMIATQEIIYDQSDGGKRVSHRNYIFLRDLFGEENVELIIYSNKGDANSSGVIRIPVSDNIISRVSNILSGRILLSKSSEKQILQYISFYEYDLVFLDRTIQGHLANLIKKQNPLIKIWSFSHNIESNYFQNKLRKYFIISKLFGKVIEACEKKQIKSSDSVFSLTERDSHMYSNLYGVDTIVFPTSFVDLYDPTKRIITSNENINELLFIGSMFGPNYDGIYWFVNNVMPNLPDYNLTIVGKNFEKKRSDLHRKNVNVVGSVDDLESYYYSENIMVMPIFYGDGQKVKTAEAMMYGKTIVASEEALVGYDIGGVDGIFCCNTVDEYVEAIKSVSKNDMIRANQSVRTLFEQKYSYEAVKNRLTPIVKELL